MSKKWTEVDVYSGLPKNEDAPANFAGAGSGVSLPPDVQISKKRKMLDARTKEYRQHRAKLEAKRKKRLEAKEKSKFIEKVKESIKNDNSPE